MPTGTRESGSAGAALPDGQDFAAAPRRAWTITHWLMLGLLLVLLAAGGVLVASTLALRFERDVARMVFNDNVDLLANIRRQVGASTDSLDALVRDGAGEAEGGPRPFLVVSIADNRVWYKQGDSVLFETQVATGSGATLVKEGGVEHWRFETPRGRLTVIGKELDPQWIPPDWHYLEAARNRGLGVVRLNRGQEITLADGGAILVRGSNVVRRAPDGTEHPATAPGEREIVADGKIVIPPFGTNQRRYPDVLGTHRLKLGDGYALHGTNNPASIGRSVTHGCIRLRNSDIAQLYEMVEVGTPVYVY